MKKLPMLLLTMLILITIVSCEIGESEIRVDLYPKYVELSQDDIYYVKVIVKNQTAESILVEKIFVKISYESINKNVFTRISRFNTLLPPFSEETLSDSVKIPVIAPPGRYRIKVYAEYSGKTSIETYSYLLYKNIYYKTFGIIISLIIVVAVITKIAKKYEEKIKDKSNQFVKAIFGFITQKLPRCLTVLIVFCVFYAFVNVNEIIKIIIVVSSTVFVTVFWKIIEEVRI